MKRLSILMIVVLNIVFSLNAIGQITADSVKLYPENTSGIVSFVIESKNSPDVAFGNAKQWIAKNFKEYKDVVKMEDAANHIIMFKGMSQIKTYNEPNTKFKMTQTHILGYTVTIECRDKKFRIKFEDLENKVTTAMGSDKRNTVSFPFNEVQERINKMSGESFIAYRQLLTECTTNSKQLIANIANSLEGAINFKDDF